MSNKITGGKPGPGRPKGSPNKLGKAAKDAIAEAAEAIGGATRLAEWVKEAPENEKAFWTVIYPKLIPVQVAGPDGEDGLPGAIQITIVDPR